MTPKNKYSLPLSGGCQCGRVRYRITAPPIALYACHCTECQKQSSAGFGMSLPVPRTGFEVSTGQVEIWARTAASGRTVECAFCRKCGTRLYHAPTRNQEIVNVKPGTLDDTAWLNPVAHLWTKSAQPWITIPKGTLNYAGQPADFSAIFEAWNAQCK